MDTPDYITELLPSNKRHVDDSLLWPSGYLFPEIREPLWPDRSFPLLDDDNSVEAAIEVQTMGLQYSVHVQMCREPGLRIAPAPQWDRKQLLWTDLPVFTEEPCEWHYPHLQVGYNIDHIDPPANLRPECNRPEFLGYLPNGDVLLYWEIAEALEREFDLEVDAVPSSLDGRALMRSTGCEEDILLESPVGLGAETGIVLSRAELDLKDIAKSYIERNGGIAHFMGPGNGTMFYRLLIPVIQCEWTLNPYEEFFWDSHGVSCNRLTGYSFRILDHPSTRYEPIFATEHGNIIVSAEFYERLSGLSGQLLGTSSGFGNVLPIIRTP